MNKEICMKKKTFVVALVVAVVCIIVLGLVGVPSRVTDEDQQRREKVSMRLEKIQAEEKAASENAEESTETEAAATEEKKEA